MKNKVLFCFLLFSASFCFAIEKYDNINSIIDDNNFNFYVSGSSGKNNCIATISIKNGYLRCQYPLLNTKIEINEKDIVIYCDVCKFNRQTLKETSRYRDFYFPKRYQIRITLEDLEKLINDKKNNSGEIFFNDSQIYPTTCQAIVIDNLNVREKPNLEGTKIGRIEKRTEVTLYEESENTDIINGEENFWYKVKLENSKEGWVYGGYVKIFFENGDMGMEDKYGILKTIK